MNEKLYPLPKTKWIQNGYYKNKKHYVSGTILHGNSKGISVTMGINLELFFTPIYWIKKNQLTQNKVTLYSE